MPGLGVPGEGQLLVLSGGWYGLESSHSYRFYMELL